MTPRPPGPAPDAGLDPGVRLPVARVAVDVPLPHLDRAFDYAVPPAWDAVAQPGVRVRVRFAGRRVGGFVLERVASSERVGALEPLIEVVGEIPVLTPEVATLCRAVADRYAGSFADVVRLAVPPRLVRAERRAPAAVAEALPAVDGPGEWAAYPGGSALLRRVGHRSRVGPRAAWTVLPGAVAEPSPEPAISPGLQWIPALTRLAQATLAAGRGVMVVVPDARDVARVDAQWKAAWGSGRHRVLSADLGPERRYRAFLDVLSGSIRAVVGTRSAAFAPVADLGLLFCWDDGDDSLAEPRAPYPHVREVLGLRARQSGAALVFGGYTRTPEVQQWVESGWLVGMDAPREVVRAAASRVQVTGDAPGGSDPQARAARLPHDAWQAARSGLEHGPVLVQVPRAGYLPALACQRCRAPARCVVCTGPLRLQESGGSPSCSWCGAGAGAATRATKPGAGPASGWICPSCGNHRLRSMRVGSARTAEELGRAFPGIPVVTSSGASVLAEVSDSPALAIATPGAEPIAAAGYAAVLLLDAATLLARTDLRVTQETWRRWAAATVLARSGAPVVLVGESGWPAVQALLRWDPVGFAMRELAERRDVGLPPAVRMAALTGLPDDVAAATASVLELLQDSGAKGPHPQVWGTLPVVDQRGSRAAPTKTSQSRMVANQPDRVRRADNHSVSSRREPDDPTAVDIRVRQLISVPLRASDALTAALRATAAGRSARKLPPIEIRLDPNALG